MTFDELKQLDPKDPGRWPFAVRVGAIALFFLVLSLALLWFGVWSANKDELARFEGEETKLRSEFRDKHAKAVNLDLYKEQLADIERSFGAMLRQELLMRHDAVAAQPRIVTLHDAVITARRGSFDDLQLDITARTYRYLDDEEQAAKANEKKATNKNSRRR